MMIVYAKKRAEHAPGGAPISLSLPMTDTLDSKTDSVFAYRREQLEEMARDVLRVARELGATDAATEISEGQGLSVTVRKGEIETIEQNRDKVVGVTVMLGKKRGNASTSDFSPAALRSTVEAALQHRPLHRR